jgi:hypothetical protein
MRGSEGGASAGSRPATPAGRPESGRLDAEPRTRLARRAAFAGRLRRPRATLHDTLASHPDPGRSLGSDS